jgi:hypothetical protein
MMCANRYSACPVISGVPIHAQGIIPINQNDVAGIPDIAMYIPDFEGQALLRIFSNSTQAEIGCFASQITNGNTVRHKIGVGLVLGVFTLVAVVASFATAVYGDNVAEMRKHYVHSLSVMVVFAVWHHIYFSGALSMNWPNILVSFWSNYAWTGGMIYSEHMQNIINEFIGSNKGNTSQIGAAGTGVSNPGLGGGYDVHAIYKRDFSVPESGFSYTGSPVKPGLPLPGNFSGFVGTLAQERIPASNAFMTCLLWSLVLIALVITSTMAFKLLLEALSTTSIIKTNRLAYFRAHYRRYTVFAILRAAFIGFFMLAFVSMFQLAYLKSPSPVAVACAVFLVVVFGIGTAAGLSCYRRIKSGKFVCEHDTLILEKTKILHVVPWFAFSRQSKSPRSEDRAYVGSIPWWTIRPSLGEKSIHDGEDFIKSFGWLASRYRSTRWWFFAVWLVYEFIRACVLAGASSQPLVQVFGLLAVECIAFIGSIYLRPFEGQRLNVVLVYLLGFSKVATTALSAAFDTHFSLPRILATVIGIVIMIVQGLLTISVLVAVTIGAITSYFSVMRNREEIRPRHWNSMRKRYFQKVDPTVVEALVEDRPQPHAIRVEPIQKVYQGAYFSVKQVRRIPKVEDEDEEFVQEIHSKLSTSQLSMSSQDYNNERKLQRSRAASDRSQVSYTALPRAARFHRPSWSSRDYIDSRSVGRERTLSNTMSCTPERPSRAMNSALPGLDSQDGVNGHASPFSFTASRSCTPASSRLSDPRLDSDESGRVQWSTPRPSVRSRSGSRPPLEGRITEEEIPQVPWKCSIRAVDEVDGKNQKNIWFS